MPVNPIVLMYAYIKGITPSAKYIPITLTNSQSSITPTPFQQLISIDPSTIGSSYFSSDLGNIRFYADSAFTQPLYAWVESGNSNTSTSTNIWVNLPNGIPANSSITIYMELLSVGTEYDGVYMGEAPQLSSTYGQYDNGASVFNNYWNFAGTSLPSGLNTLLNGGSVTVNNGVTLSTGSAETDVYSSTTLTTPAIVEALATSDSNSDAGVFFSETDITSTPSSGANINNGYIGGYSLGTKQELWKDINGNYYSLTSDGSATYPAILSLIWGGTGNLETTFNYGSALTSTDTSFSVGSGWIVGLTTYNHGSSPYAKYQWLRTRAYPPNGVMPTVSIGSIA